RGGFEATERLLLDHPSWARTDSRFLRAIAALVSVDADPRRASDVDRRVYNASIPRHQPRRRSGAHGASPVTATGAFTRYGYGARLRGHRSGQVRSRGGHRRARSHGASNGPRQPLVAGAVLRPQGHPTFG